MSNTDNMSLLEEVIKLGTIIKLDKPEDNAIEYILELNYAVCLEFENKYNCNVFKMLDSITIIEQNELFKKHYKE